MIKMKKNKNPDAKGLAFKEAADWLELDLVVGCEIVDPGSLGPEMARAIRDEMYRLVFSLRSAGLKMIGDKKEKK